MTETSKVTYISSKPKLTVDVSPQWTAQFVDGILELTDPVQIEAMQKYRKTASHAATSLFKELDVEEAARVAIKHKQSLKAPPSSIQGGTHSQSHETARQDILRLQSAETIARDGGHNADLKIAGAIPENSDPNLVATETVKQPSLAPNTIDVKTTPANDQSGQQAKVTAPLRQFNFNKTNV